MHMAAVNHIKLFMQLLVVSMAHQFHVSAGDESMSTISTMWGEYYNSSDTFSNSYAICVLEAGKLVPSCSGTFHPYNNTQAPTDVQLSALSGGAYFSCGLIYGTKRAVCWGDDRVLNTSFPYQANNYSSLSSGTLHVCALRDMDGGIDCWGLDIAGETIPPKGNYLFKLISSGWGFTCALEESGEAHCWGREDVTYNTTVPKPDNIYFSDIASGGLHVCALERNTRRPFCWGWIDYNHWLTPPTDKALSAITSGKYHSCGIVNNTGKVVCWGDDTFKQVRDTPSEETFSSIVAGDFYTCGMRLKELQTVRCWGNSIVYTSNVKVSQGLCTEGKCTGGKYELPDKAVGNIIQCPNTNERICLDSQVTEGHSSKKNSERTTIVALAATGGLVFIILAGGLSIFSFFQIRGFWSKHSSPTQQAWTSLANRLIPFTPSELVTATQNYSSDMIIGQGSFGVVYRGVLPTGRSIAIKRSQIANDKMLVKELELLSRLHHTNLVNLVGYCADEKLLAFDYMENGSLYDCLFKKADVKLDWFTRLKIAAQAARGLEYLHVYASPQILHRDVKSANILLDKDWNAHVADFGLCLNTNESFATLAGTPGYIDPTYVQTMHFTTKSDVFSFGVVLLELVTGRRALESHITLVSLVENRDMSSIIDPRLEINDVYVFESVHQVVELALNCTCTTLGADKRPSMTSVANLLDQVLKTNSTGTSTSETDAGSGSVEVASCSRETSMYSSY